MNNRSCNALANLFSCFSGRPETCKQAQGNAHISTGIESTTKGKTYFVELTMFQFVMLQVRELCLSSGSCSSTRIPAMLACFELDNPLSTDNTARSARCVLYNSLSFGTPAKCARCELYRGLHTGNLAKGGQ
ncbi:hypothetical protein LOK49_LG02G01202 [Camellia lanceoleosa]|uniref:Uncharacterized protein n=1 Tax=Camellia lanceoleosa TaxID=1840588 RepID=A0ACC0IM95_9ERIC|nr:hypothetical protein LOK49_LG02G01202 [Camellia lanceoleosa]